MKITKYQKYILYTGLIIGVLISLYPFYWIIVNSTWGRYGVFAFPPHFLFGDKLGENFKNLNEAVDLLRVFYNSAFVAVVSTLFSIIISLLSSYAFAKYEFKGKNFLFSTLLFSMMIPHQATMVSLFNLFLELDLMNTYTALIVPGMVNIFTIFLLRQALIPFPDELLEAGRMDGANELKILIKIVVPNLKPAIAASTIFIFMGHWNNFMWPLIIAGDPEMRTLPVMLSSLRGLNVVEYGQIMTGITVATAPIMIVFILLSRHFVSSVLGTGTKG